jgi:hypothetical protein
MEEQQRQKRPLTGAAEHDRMAVVVDLEWAEDAEFHCPRLDGTTSFAGGGRGG